MLVWKFKRIFSDGLKVQKIFVIWAWKFKNIFVMMAWKLKENCNDYLKILKEFSFSWPDENIIDWNMLLFC